MHRAAAGYGNFFNIEMSPAKLQGAASIFPSLLKKFGRHQGNCGDQKELTLEAWLELNALQLLSLIAKTYFHRMKYH